MPPVATASKFRVGLVQMSMAQDPRMNLRRASGKVQEAAERGATVVCLPELFRTRYFCQSEDAAMFDLAEPVPGPTTRALGKLAAKTGVVILSPIFERRAEGVYHNSTAVIGPDGKLAGLYRKMHVPDDPSYYEKFYFAPGDRGFEAFDTPFGRIGVLICWDQWFPEAARLTALRGADVLFYPTAIGWRLGERQAVAAQQYDAWRTVQRGHAIANGVYVAAVNRVGTEPGDRDGTGIRFWGGSFLADPFGVVLAEAPQDAEAILIGEIDLRRIAEVRRAWPFLRDRRIDAYGGIDKRFLD